MIKQFKLNPSRGVAVWTWLCGWKAAGARQPGWLLPWADWPHSSQLVVPTPTPPHPPTPSGAIHPLWASAPVPKYAYSFLLTHTCWQHGVSVYLHTVISSVRFYQPICQLGFLSSSHQLSSLTALRHCRSRDVMGVVCHETACWCTVCTNGRFHACAVSKMFPRHVNILRVLCKNFLTQLLRNPGAGEQPFVGCLWLLFPGMWNLRTAGCCIYITGYQYEIVDSFFSTTWWP